MEVHALELLNRSPFSLQAGALTTEQLARGEFSSLICVYTILSP